MRTLAATRAFRELARVPSQTSKAVSKRIAIEIQKQFDKGLDPYGRPWKPLAPATLAKGRHPPPLTDSGDGRRSVTVKPLRGAGIQISIDVKYMEYHQYGDPPKLPRRQILPENVLPKAWSKILREELELQIQKKLKNV